MKPCPLEGHRQSALAIAGTILYAALVGLSCSGSPTPRSAILITIDTLRADHLSQGGYRRNTSPVLDALAARGTRFSWAFSTSSYTVPSHASIMLGRYPSFHGPGLTNSRDSVTPAETTLAELLVKSGFRTLAVVSNYVLRRRVGLAQGFDLYDDEFSGSEDNRDMPERRADHAVDRALTLLPRIDDEPFFLWLHLQDPHGPYRPPKSIPRPLLREGFSESEAPGTALPLGRDNSGFGAIAKYQSVAGEERVEQYLARYEREVSFIDTQIGRFLDELGQRGLLDTTLIAVTADHGEAMGEDGFWCSARSNRRLGHCRGRPAEP